MHELRFCPACAAPLDTSGRAAVCPACSWVSHRDPKVGVGVVVRDAQGRLLLVRRANDPQLGRWALPAGFVDAGEDPRAAAARETLEETGLVVLPGAVIDVYPTGAQGGATFFLAFEAELVGGTLAAGDDAADVAFFGPDELPELAFASTLAAVSQLR